MYKIVHSYIQKIVHFYIDINKYSRLRYTWFTNAHDTYASSEFAKRLVKYFPFKVKRIQTDNGFEFTNRLSWQAFMKSKKTMFENTLEELGISDFQIPKNGIFTWNQLVEVYLKNKNIHKHLIRQINNANNKHNIFFNLITVAIISNFLFIYIILCYNA